MSDIEIVNFIGSATRVAPHLYKRQGVEAVTSLMYLKVFHIVVHESIVTKKVIPKSINVRH